MVCPNCKAQVPDTASFCPNCGADVTQTADEHAAQTPQGVRGRVGFSDDVNSEELQAARKKTGRITLIVGIVLVLLPLIGFLIYGAVTDQMKTALPTGLIVSLIFLVTTVIVGVRRLLDKPFEGEVTEKRTRRVTRGGSGHRTHDTEYLLYVKTDGGRKKKKKVMRTAFDYVRVGDRVRYHPGFAQAFEKYDKSDDTEVPCMMCGRMNPIEQSHCRFCKNLLVR